MYIDIAYRPLADNTRTSWGLNMILLTENSVFQSMILNPEMPGK